MALMSFIILKALISLVFSALVVISFTHRVDPSKVVIFLTHASNSARDAEVAGLAWWKSMLELEAGRVHG